MPTHEANLKGTTSKMIEVKAFDATTGQGATGKVYTDFTCYYVREGASAATAVTLVTATLGTFTSGGLKEISAANAKGVYQFGVPNAAIAAGAGDKVTFYFECTGCIIPPQIVPLVAYNPQLAYITPGTGTGQLDVSGGRAPADVVYFGGVPGTFSGGIPEVNVIKFAGTPNGDLAGGVQDGLNAQGYLSGRATLLDNLDGAISDVRAAITGLNNLSALANLYGSPLLEIPDSSSTLFAYTLVVRDNEGKLVDLDASPTIAAANAAGTSRSANLSAVSHPATGRYTFTYSVSSAAAEESLRITCSGTVSAEGRYVEWIGAVVNYDTLTMLADIQTKAGTAATQSTTAATQATAAAASAAANTTAFTAIKGAGWGASDNLHQIRQDIAGVSGGGGGGGFTGPSAVTLTFHDSAAAIVAGATFTVVGVGSATADGSGVASFDLADGTYTVRTGPTLGVLFDDAELVVSGATALTITGTTVQASLPAPPGVGLATGYLDCLDTLGAPAPGAQIEVQRTATTGSAGQSALRESVFADADGSGRVTITLQASTAFRARRDNGPWVAFTSTGSGTTFALPYLLGQAG